MLDRNCTSVVEEVVVGLRRRTLWEILAEEPSTCQRHGIEWEILCGTALPVTARMEGDPLLEATAGSSGGSPANRLCARTLALTVL